MPRKAAKDKPTPKKRRPKVSTEYHGEEKQLETPYFFQLITPTATDNVHPQPKRHFKAVKVGSSQLSEPPAPEQWTHARQADGGLHSFQIKSDRLIRVNRGVGRYSLFNKPYQIPTKKDEEIAIAALLQLANTTK